LVYSESKNVVDAKRRLLVEVRGRNGDAAELSRYARGKYAA
jgi:hypothetical protein